MLNKVTLIGALGRDPEVRYTTDGTPIANFSVATSESWKDKNTGEKKEATEWHRITAYGKLAEIVGEYAKKGTRMYLEGKLKTRKWQDKDGQDKYTTEIQMSEMKLLGGGNRQSADEGSSGGDMGGDSGGFSNSDMDDDIPF